MRSSFGLIFVAAVAVMIAAYLSPARATSQTYNNTGVATLSSNVMSGTPAALIAASGTQQYFLRTLNFVGSATDTILIQDGSGGTTLYTITAGTTNITLTPDQLNGCHGTAGNGIFVTDGNGPHATVSINCTYNIGSP